MATSTDDPTSSDEEVWDLLAGSADASTAATDEEPSAAVVAALKAEQPPPCVPTASVEPASPADPSASAVSVVPATSAPAAPAARAVAGTRQLRRPARGRAARIPHEILEDQELNNAIAAHLPSSYEFEVHRTVWRLRRCAARHVGLQMPEGLQRWATILADIFRRFVPSLETATILGDVTFGACCIDDLASRALGMDFLVHYGHSCIVPVDQTTVTMLYVHVEVQIDVDHLVETVRLNFAPDQRLAFMGTVQFTAGIMHAVEELKREFLTEGSSGHVPQVKPLGVGEVLGCTSPAVVDADAVVFVCDGRFHLESAMIQNPHVKHGFFRYDPFYRTLTQEGFAHAEMHRQRRAAIEAAKGAAFVGLILGTLGRQGSSGVLEELERVLDKRGVPYFTLLLSEVSPERLALFRDVDAWVQVACPRLSLDWGDAYVKPLLTPYEAHVAFGDYTYKDVYPMDYYSNKGGPWSNYGAHNGHGGSLGQKFRHLGHRKHTAVEYEDDAS